MNVLDDIHKQQKTIILSTHDVNLAYEWADDIIVMHDGQILCQGDPVTVFEQDELIKKAHLNKPWIMETFQFLMQEKLLSSSSIIPQTKEELFQKIRDDMKVFSNY